MKSKYKDAKASLGSNKTSVSFQAHLTVCICRGDPAEDRALINPIDLSSFMCIYVCIHK